jgi:hypothetical protein
VGELTVSGFPRTGTTYFQQIVKSAFPSLEVIHGYHRILPLKQSGMKAITLRNPCDAVSSWIVFSHPRPVVVDDALDWYCQFIEQALLSPATIIVADFNHFTSQPNNAMDLVGQRLGIEPTNFDQKELDLKMQKNLSRNFPNADTQLKNKYALSVAGSSVYKKTMGMYEEALLI